MPEGTASPSPAPTLAPAGGFSAGPAGAIAAALGTPGKAAAAPPPPFPGGIAPALRTVTSTRSPTASTCAGCPGMGMDSAGFLTSTGSDTRCTNPPSSSAM